MTVVDHARGTTETSRPDDPLEVPKRLAASWRVVTDGPTGRPEASFCGGWVGYAGYDVVRYLEALAEARTHHHLLLAQTCTV